MGRLSRALAAVVAVLAACSLHQATAAPVANVGLLIPTSGASCMRTAEFWFAAKVAQNYIQQQSWWPNVTLNVSVISADTSYVAWKNALSYVQSLQAAGNPPIALVGPTLSDAMLYVRFVASGANIPVVGFSTTSAALTDLDGAVANTFFRTCQCDLETTKATYKMMNLLGLQEFNVLYVHDSFGQTFYEQLTNLSLTDGNLTLVKGAFFESGAPDTIEVALEEIKESLARVTIIVCQPDDAQLVLKAAYALGMTGKGWQYIGAGWVQAHVWLDNQTPEDQLIIQQAMQGVLGIRPDDDITPQFQNGLLETYMYNASNPATSYGNPATCPGLLGPAFAAGVQTSPYAPYAFDAVWAIASAYANAYAINPATANGAAVRQQMLASNITASPLTHNMIFLPSGDKFNVTLNLVNIVGQNIVKIGTWFSTVPNVTNATSAEYLQSGYWGPFGTIIYADGTTAVPTDRVAEADHLGIWFYFLVLLGVVVSVLLGSAMHRNHIYAFPESGATVIVGMIIGLFLLAVSNQHLIQKAKFDPHLFSLALLPIIIFESGYSLNLDAFFSQFGAILTFALAGTVSATIITGVALYQFGISGAVPLLSFEEAMAFASLISATDPVATLSVFSALNVEPHLYSIVYGEAVLNDAVAIVLYRTFTNFLTVQSNSALWVIAVLTFFGILIGSTIVGLVFGLVSTYCFKHLHMAIEGSDGRAETGVLLVFAYASYAFAEACSLSGIVASLFCGIAMNHYNTKVLSDRGRDFAYHSFKLLAYLSETSVFVQVGVNVIAFIGDFRFGLVVLMIILCIVARAIQVFTFANILNCFRKKPIPSNHTIQIFLAGLRGAIAYALSTGFPSQNIGIVINATSCIVVFTIFVMGGTTTTSLKLLKIECGGEAHGPALKKISEASLLDSKWKRALANFDNSVVKPFLYRKEVELRDSAAAETEATPAHV